MYIFHLQNGDECWCGNNYGRYQDRDEGKCTEPCQTEPETKCGGGWRNSVYRRHDTEDEHMRTLSTILYVQTLIAHTE